MQLRLYHIQISLSQVKARGISVLHITYKLGQFRKIKSIPNQQLYDSIYQLKIEILKNINVLEIDVYRVHMGFHSCRRLHPNFLTKNKILVFCKKMKCITTHCKQ